jgi:hypothetical protein
METLDQIAGDDSHVSGTRRYYYSSVALLLAATVLAYFAVPERPPAKHELLVASPDVFDFGGVKRGELAGEFTLTNESPSTIQLLHVIRSCSCQSVDVPRKRMEPKESVHAAFQWDVRRLRGESYTQFIVVYKVVGEGEIRYTKCVCRGDVTAPFEIEPNEFSFFFARKELQTARVTFLSTEHRDFAVQEALCVHPAFSATCDRKTNEVVVSFDPSRWHDEDGACEHHVKVRTTKDSLFDCLVPIRVRN